MIASAIIHRTIVAPPLNHECVEGKASGSGEDVEPRAQEGIFR